MPLVSSEGEKDYIWGLWHLSEDEASLRTQMPGIESDAISISNLQKRVEHLAARILLAELLRVWNLPFPGVLKDEAGKPYFKELPFHLSLTHSYPYVGAIIHKNKSVGIDLEQPKQKLLNVAERVMNRNEFEDAGNDIIKHCIYWCAKEALIKVYGKRHLHLAKELAIQPFERKNDGHVIGSIIAPDMYADIKLYYRVYDNFVIVLNT